MNLHFRFGPDFNFLRPGLEVKHAVEAAEQVGANVEFLGSEMNQVTWQRLYHETRLNGPHYLAQRYNYMNTAWDEELFSNRHKMGLVGPSAFSEKCLDANQMNWFIQSMDVFFPKLKAIFVDQRDEDLFKQIE